MPDSPDERRRNDAYRRILAAAQEGGTSLDRLHELLRQLEQNEAQTAELLRTVYGIPEEFLSDYLELMVREASSARSGGPSEE